nr:geranylgeranyl diphosphate synthase [uncultured archaeon]
MPEMDELKNQINEDLSGFLDAKVKEAENIFSSSYDIAKVLREYTMRGGKRIRACMTVFAFLCFKDFDEGIIKAAISMELVQSCLLIHDDIIDEDDLRRGGKTVHKIYEEIEKDRHFGESAAILVGDLANAFIIETIMRTDFDAAAKLKAIGKIQEMFVKECYGQMEDIFMEKHKGNSDAILKMYSLKTVPYTADAPLYIGAVLGNANRDAFKILEEWGSRIGLAFQIKDDIIGVFGKKEETGKPNDSDIKKGKNTFLIHKTREMCTAEEKKFIDGCLGNENASEEDIKKAREIIRNCGALDFCENFCNNLAKEAGLILEKSGFRKEGIESLGEMASFIINRNY